MQTALMAPGSDVTALRDLFAEFPTDTGTVQRIADLLAGADVRYDVGLIDPHGPTGWFAPSTQLELADGATIRLPELFRTACTVILDATGDLRNATEPWADRIDYVPIAGQGANASMLVRPDGFVAWSNSDPTPLVSALHTWFGEPNSGHEATHKHRRIDAKRPFANAVDAAHEALFAGH